MRTDDEAPRAGDSCGGQLYDLALGLIMNAEACGGGEEGGAAALAASHELLSLVLMCCYQLFLVLGVQGTLQEETLIHRVYLKLLQNKSLMEVPAANRSKPRGTRTRSAAPPPATHAFAP